jgi:hypothetical protein
LQTGDLRRHTQTLVPLVAAGLRSLKLGSSTLTVAFADIERQRATLIAQTALGRTARENRAQHLFERFPLIVEQFTKLVRQGSLATRRPA